MLVLGIESSCDDTAAALVRDGREVMASVVGSQDDFHRRYGGVVPEIASRKHLEVIDGVVAYCLEKGGVALADIDAVAVTAGPGLMGSLLVGLNFGKSMAYAAGAPFIGVDHLEAHMAAPFLGVEPPQWPIVGLVVSGGHTNLYEMSDFDKAELLGRTVDDAAGEAFDKIAKYLGLGYPGGRAIDELATKGDASAFDLPRPMLHSGDFFFSFSGLKTAAITAASALEQIDDRVLADMAASFQEAVVDVLCAKLEAAAKSVKVKGVAASGGVAANSRLRKRIRELADKNGWRLFLPAYELCTDNAAMVAAAGYYRLVRGDRSTLNLDSYAKSAAVPKGRMTKREMDRISKTEKMK